MDLVSIIIPVYNVANYLDKCVASACGQTYKDTEIILVDDGATDSCPQKCDDWAAKDSRIRVIHKQNGGLSSARNAGLDIAKGKYIYFLDSDDYIEKELVETVINNFSDDVDMVIFGHYKIDETGRIAGAFSVKKQDFSQSNDSAMRFIFSTLYNHQEACLKMFKKSVIDDYQLRFADNRMVFAEDYCFGLCYSAHCKKIRCIPDVLYYYLQRSNSIMGVYFSRNKISNLARLSESVYRHYEQWDDCKELIENFPAIHYLIMLPEIQRVQNKQGLSAKELRTLVKRTVENQKFFRRMIKKPSEESKKYLSEYKRFDFKEWGNWFEYYSDGCYPKLIIKNRLLYKNAKPIINFSINQFVNLIEKFAEKNKATPCIYYLCSDAEKDYGCHRTAKTVAEFFADRFPQLSLLEVTAECFPYVKNNLIKLLKPTDIIVLSGGEESKLVYEEVITTWSDNKKIIFPQTVFFDDSDEGQSALKRAESIFVPDNNVVLFAREKPSFEYAKLHFSCRVELAPDIVLYTPKMRNVQRKDRILLCLRSDKEKQSSEEEDMKLYEAAKEFADEVIWFDTQHYLSIEQKIRNQCVETTLDLFASTKLMITDRPHGMIFAAITGTPCIALVNNNNKLTASYEWLKSLPYIKMAKDVDEVKKLIPELLTLGECQFDNSSLMPYYETLEDTIKEALK